MTEENSSKEISQLEAKEQDAGGEAKAKKNLEELLKAAGESNDYAEKLRLYDEALALDPGYLDAWLQKGFALDRMGRSEEAIACYDMALEVDPENFGIWCLKGFALNNLKEFEKAVECYEEVLKSNSEDVFAWYQKGTSLENMGRYGDAMKCYDIALEIDPTDALIREKRMKLLAIIYKKGSLTDSEDNKLN
ncbi:tetratricopeptide repeat protein [Methanosarcina sp. KYL-1]|uniref:tetratricopeptide repeat protein n=1 Tax=Methanosarcina sp. KYL-1 TaxID=2602068 RepID=UPI0021015D03|nr:tetratricopeptide repeat protein [Methanosarcina sp. KYL-1]MCQ1535683.1 tetratricopeptide repeat protein [Methanosarcina sp. KYL-1]